MPRLHYFLALLPLVFVSDVLADDYPLFNSEDTLEIALEVPMKTLIRRARKKPVLDGQLQYLDSDGTDVTIDLTITTRGKSRLEHCSFPPLAISLDKEQTASTLFAGQRRLKIVTHCRNGSKYRRYFHQEYGIYRAYKLLSDYSFRVRALTITFRDSEKKRRDLIVPGFFIESDREVARRMNMKTIKTREIRSSQFNVAETNKFEVFQYMIANTDWAIRKGPSTEDCCHNGKVIGPKGAEDDWVVLPYDFDQAGIINTEYALPAIGLGIRTVKQRKYRGRCGHNDQLPETIALFNERRSDLEAAILPQELSDRTRKSALKYLDVFYTTMNDPKRLNAQVIDVCRGGKKT